MLSKLLYDIERLHYILDNFLIKKPIKSIGYKLVGFPDYCATKPKNALIIIKLILFSTPKAPLIPNQSRRTSILLQDNL